MLKKSITFTDYNDVEHTEDFYFNITKSELAEMEFEAKHGLSNLIKEIVASEDNAAVMAQFKKLILKSYGKKSEDGLRFMKTPEFAEEFLESPAFDAFFMDMFQGENAKNFVKGILPKDMQKSIEKEEASEKQEQTKQ